MAGLSSAAGARGAQGPVGPAGAQGPVGPAGAQGPQGPARPGRCAGRSGARRPGRCAGRPKGQQDQRAPPAQPAHKGEAGAATEPKWERAVSQPRWSRISRPGRTQVPTATVPRRTVFRKLSTAVAASTYRGSPPSQPARTFRPADRPQPAGRRVQQRRALRPLRSHRLGPCASGTGRIVVPERVLTQDASPPLKGILLIGS